MKPADVSILGLPESAHSTVAGLADVFNIFPLLHGFDDALPDQPPFHACVVGAGNAPEGSVPFRIDLQLAEIERTDIVIIPSLMVSAGQWRPGAHPEVVDWLRAMHAEGAVLCSACSGALLLAETGLLNGGEATTHWAYAGAFRKYFPDVQLRLENLLVRTGERQEFVMSGAIGSWHDLALFLIARHAGLAAAQAVARFLLLEWHADGQLPYVEFVPPRDHGDAVVADAQRWLDANHSVANPVEAVTTHSGLAPRTFKRRFTAATGLAPLHYVQQLRVTTAKRRLERTSESVDEIAWRVGYEDPAFFRRLFRRITGVSPSAYRRKLRLPDFAH